MDAVPWQRLRFLVDFWVDVWQVPEVFGGFFEEIYGIFRGVGEIDGNLVENDWECLDLGKSDHLPNPEFFGMECISFQALSSIKFPMFTNFTKSEHHF